MEHSCVTADELFGVAVSGNAFTVDLVIKHHEHHMYHSGKQNILALEHGIYTVIHMHLVTTLLGDLISL